MKKRNRKKLSPGLEGRKAKFSVDSSAKFRSTSIPVNQSEIPDLHSSARACGKFNYIQDFQQTNQLDPVKISSTPYRHQLESSKPLQKEVISTQKLPGSKKRSKPVKNSQCGKSCEIKGTTKNGCGGIGTLQMTKILITAIQVNFMLIPSEIGIRQHELT